MPSSVSQMRSDLSRRVASAYGPGTRDYSSLQPQQNANPDVASFLQALASHLAAQQQVPQQTWNRPMRDASTDVRFQHRTYGGGISWTDPWGDLQEVQAHLYPATGGRDHGYMDVYNYENGRQKYDEFTSEIPYFFGIQPSVYNGYIDAALNGSLKGGNPAAYIQGRTRF